MSYAITEKDIPVENFEEVLRGRLSHDHAARRAKEEDGARASHFTDRVSNGKVRKDLLQSYEAAVATAKKAAKDHELAEEQVASYAEQAKRTDKIGETAAAMFVSATANQQRLFRISQEAQAAANEIQDECSAHVPAALLAHVAVMYDAQIEAGIRAAMAYVATMKGIGDAVTKVTVEISGHVEHLFYKGGNPADRDQGGTARGFAGVRVWPSE